MRALPIACCNPNSDQLGQIHTEYVVCMSHGLQSTESIRDTVHRYMYTAGLNNDRDLARTSFRRRRLDVVSHVGYILCANVTDDE